MRKADVIAQCLLQSSMASNLKSGRESVRKVFENSFPDKSFSKWNGVLEINVANSIIRSVGKAKSINVEKFIADLS